jgi:hypothetical protein
MRDSRKNQQWIWYALRNVSASQDEWENTKDVTTYSEPQKRRISVSANKGEAEAEAFGKDLKYDRVMITHDITCPIDEFSRLWIKNKETDTHDYEVAAVSKSLNCIRYAIRRVNVSK